MTHDRSAQIRWMDWGEEAFEKAEKQDKLILLDIGASWCHWCHVMDRATYSDPAVIELVNERFIPVRVDGDKRPDVQDRYLLGGWPTTAWLIPDGRILTGTTFVPPEAMLHKLKEVDALFHENKALVTMQVTSMEAEAEADRTEAEIAVETILADTLESLSNVLKQEFDPINGGFGNEPKFAYPDGVRFAFRRYWKTSDEEMLNMAVSSLDGEMGICDPVWGGFYRYAVKSDWTEPHYEKLLHTQSGAMDNFLEAYQVTGEDEFGETAAGIKSYVMRFLADTERGGFYGSQDADLDSHDPETDMILGEKYYSVDETERLSMGIPYVDKTVFTDWNGMMISAFLRLHHVMGDRHAQEFALKTLDRVKAENWCGQSMCHYSDGEQRLPGILSDQVYFSQSLVDAYQSTGVRKYLEDAETLVGFMISELQDVVDGGFYFRPFDPHIKFEPLERHKPFDENVAAVSLLTRMSYLTGKEEYRRLAERTLRGISYPQAMESIIGMGYGIAVDTFMSHPLHIVLVGDKNKDETQRMLETSLHAYEPDKLVQVLDPSEGSLSVGEVTFEADEGTRAYVCMDSVCHPPIASVSELTALLENVSSGT